MGSPAPAPRNAVTGTTSATPQGEFVVMDGAVHYRISAYQGIEPFLMSLPSDTDLWMFIASGGGLTAGRVDAEGSLFPYQTVDQLHDSHHHTGPLTLIQVEREADTTILWEPFAPTDDENPGCERNLYKNVVGNSLVFEEIRPELGLTFRYSWSACDEFGWVRTATLENSNAESVRVRVLDGLRNILPHGAPLHLYQQASNLVDAYKKSEVDPETGLGIYSLTAGITDRAEAIEVLRANTVWCSGLAGARVHLSLDVVPSFRAGRVLTTPEVMNGKRGNYLVSGQLDVPARGQSSWHLVGDAGRDHLQIAELRRRLREDEDLPEQITAKLRRASENLQRYVASADGLQLTGQPESWAHHFANVLFNNMRGGVFAENYDVPVADFSDFLRVRNAGVAARHKALLTDLPDPVTIQDLNARARETGDADFERLCHEYLPLHFGRRHGDPSRPWNRFAIRVRNGSGERVLNYQGNWRDIFQNWEALCTSFPGFLPNIVAKFVNASTVDGFNPYRLSRDGVDWEVVEPDDPWSNIGYWGDHQIIYLLKLLEAWQDHDPAALSDMLAAEIFSYAEVPYRLKPYPDMLRDPSETIIFDSALADRIDARVASRGTDGKLLTGPDGLVYHANLLEKLLVPVLSKLSNLVLDGGIWMNTQRPEWNDANNALAGGGVSVVTLCYLRRYLAFFEDLLARQTDRKLPVSTKVATWFYQIADAFEGEQDLLVGDRIGARDRKRLLDLLGGAFSTYRESVYAQGFSGRTHLSTRRVAQMCRSALAFVDWGIAANRREDGLYHTYNLLAVANDGSGADLVRLPKMLEGQVAVLSAGVLEPKIALEILESLFASDLYRPDQASFILYPERQLPGFLAKNALPETDVAEIGLLQGLLAAKNQDLLSRDADGICRFHGDFGNADDLAAALDELGQEDEWSDAVARDRDAVLALFESVFRHRSYTGRSGTMYGYEGLGCIYWHMIAKLLLAVQETAQQAEDDGAAATVQTDLAQMYYRIRSGIGYEKSVSAYGAFPTDPYSHTPPSGGAKQPGMTGQVKEEILTRRGEFGVRVQSGALRFAPTLLQAGEFSRDGQEFWYVDCGGKEHAIALPGDSLAFTICQVPVIYQLGGEEARIQIEHGDGSTSERAGDLLEAPLSAEIFGRTGRVRRLQIHVPEAALNHD